MSALNVLLVTYVFPPAGGVGVLRAASFARYFPGEEIRLDVLTARNASAVGRDPTLLKEIPTEVTVHRTITLDLPFDIKKGIKRLITGAKSYAGKTAVPAVAGKPNLFKRVLENILLPDPQVTWLPVLARAARRIVREREIDLVLITAPPFSNVLLVEKLRKEFPRLAMVVDFRDEWLSTTIDFIGFSRGKRARRVARKIEASAVANATAIVAVTEAARREIRARYPQEPDYKFQLIPNGFDATWPNSSMPHSGRRPGGIITVTYIGTVYSSTDPTTLVEALKSLPAELKSRFKLRFIGHIEDRRYREALLQLGDMVELKGYLPQHEALAAMCETDYALLVSRDHLNVSAKFYDYIGAYKPILACVHPDGGIRIMLEDLRAGWWADIHDVADIRRLFLDAAARCSTLVTAFKPDTKKIARYERKVLAQRYAALLRSIAGKQYESGAKSQAAELTLEVG